MSSDGDNDSRNTYKGKDAEISDYLQLNKATTMSSGSLVTAQLPTLYEHYTSGGIVNGLSDAQPYFTLNNKNITLYSGAMHYFRIPQASWRDRLRKARAAGLNVVETYVPWNLHEPQPGVFEWGSGESGSDHAQFLDLQRFLKMAQEEDLLAIVRPGPYICAEWDFGGLPSWLLREKDIKIRTSDSIFMKHVTRYFNALLTILAALQFTNGGPIIAFQLENEYGSTRVGIEPTDKQYLHMLKDLMKNNGINELLFTSDSPLLHGDQGAIPGVLQTANFNTLPEIQLKKLQQLQPGKPLMVMEYWSGWYDHWSEKHHTVTPDQFESVLTKILQYPASVNFYIFHGGTNWGFLNGANIHGFTTDNSGFQPDTTSYDYDAPLTEAGDYTEKYNRVKNIINKMNPIKTKLPSPPNLISRVAYPTVKITEQISLQDLENQITNKVNSATLLSMEQLPINNNSGQSYGYIIYKKTNLNIPSNSILQISGHVCDTVMVLINGVLKSKPLESSNDFSEFGYWKKKDSILDLGSKSYENATLELVVENWGRVNWGILKQFNQFKGLWHGPVLINSKEINNWEIIPLEFKTKWSTSLTGWQTFKTSKDISPALYRGRFTVNEPKDTFIDWREWNKGVVIINGFVLGRYAFIGPQLSLYLPGSFLNEGQNEILFFEHFSPAQEINFNVEPLWT